MARAAPLDRVAGQRERGPGEADQRDRRAERRPDRADRLEDVIERLRVRPAAGCGRRRPPSRTGLWMTGPSPLANSSVEAQRLEDQQDVGEEDRGVDPQPLGGGDRDLGGQLGVACRVQERDLRAAARGIRACSGPPAASARSGVTSVGSRRQALRKGESGGSRRGAIGERWGCRAVHEGRCSSPGDCVGRTVAGAACYEFYTRRAARRGVVGLIPRPRGLSGTAAPVEYWMVDPDDCDQILTPDAGRSRRDRCRRRNGGVPAVGPSPGPYYILGTE